MSGTAILVSAPGKVILCGEHAVVHGRTAIAVSLGLRTFVRLTSARALDTVRLDLPDIGIHATWPVAELQALRQVLFGAAAPAEQPVTPELRAALEAAVKADGSSKSLATVAFVYLFLAIGLDSVNGGDGAHFEVQSTLPIGAGLGSSAAFATALAAGLLLWRARRGNDAPGTAVTGELINFWAFRSEQLVHGTPSGLDNYTSTFGGALSFRSGQVKRLEGAPTLRFLLTNTKVPRTTRALVARVGDLKTAFPAVMEPVLDAVQGVTDSILALFKAGEINGEGYRKIEQLLRMNHQLLNTMGVGHPALDAVCQTTAEFELSSKLTGAGGGGCAITFLRPETPAATVAAVREALAARGFEAFETEVGGPGVLEHGPPEDPDAPFSTWPALRTFPPQ